MKNAVLDNFVKKYTHITGKDHVLKAAMLLSNFSVLS